MTPLSTPFLPDSHRATRESSSIPRLAWIDNLRTAMIVLVVNMHACVTYSHLGGWYRMEDPEPGMPVKIFFILWQGHLQAFFMGLLFFIAGVFAHASVERRGPAPFLRERARRLGLPSLLYMLAIHPFMVYVLLGQPQVSNRPSLAALYADYLGSGRVLSGNGPMWFALALLLFCAALVAVRALGSSRVRSPGSPRGSEVHCPGTAALLGFGGVLVMSTFIVRLVEPLGTDVLNFQLGFFAQYVAAFIAGVIAGKHGWLESLATSRRARLAGWIGLVGGPLVFMVVAALGGPPPPNMPNPYAGGWNLRAFGLAAWEQGAGLALGLGVLAWFHRRWNSSGRLARWLSERAFAVYVFHPPVLVALTPLLRPLAGNPFVGAALLTLTGLVASFLVADGARRVPGLRAIL